MASATSVLPNASVAVSSGRSYRIQSLDVLRGLLMVLMAIDHTRDFFSSASIDPADPVHSWPALFATRWITHLCAPGFILLAGASVYLQRQRKSASTVSRSLLLRGLWLIFLEITLVTLGWSFNFGIPILQVIWVIGASMIVLAGLLWLPLPAVGLFSGLVIFGHDLLDGIHADTLGRWKDAWQLLHERGYLTWHHHPFVLYGYPLLPWVGVMALGYCLGPVLLRSASERQRWAAVAGVASLMLFTALRLLHGYGDPGDGFQHLGSASHTAMSFLSVQKYPPSVHYLLATLGVVLLLFALIDRVTETAGLSKVRGFLEVFGKVPFFFYILHIFLIHAAALVVAYATGANWRYWITPDVVFTSHLDGWGFGLPVVYLIWIAVVLALYPACAWFSRVKDRNRSWWLAYL